MFLLKKVSLLSQDSIVFNNGENEEEVGERFVYEDVHQEV